MNIPAPASKSLTQLHHICERIAMNVIAKMRCTSIEDFGYNRKIKFSCVHDAGINIGDNPENRAFTNATPSGEAWMTIDNRNVWPAFHPALPDLKPVDNVYKSTPETVHYVLFVDANEHSLDDVHRALGALDAKDS